MVHSENLIMGRRACQGDGMGVAGFDRQTWAELISFPALFFLHILEWRPKPMLIEA